MKGPNVRVEMRKVYVGARGATLSKHAAYVQTAKAMIAAKCACDPDVGFVCGYHRPCCSGEGPGGYGCEHKDRLPEYMRVKRRLIGFMKFVDKRMVAGTEFKP